MIVPVLLAAVFFITITSGRHKHYHLSFALGGVVLSAIFILLDFSKIVSDKIMVYYQLGWKPPLGITFSVDLLNYVVCLLLIFVAVSALAISRTEIRDDKREFYALFMLFLLGLFGAAMTGDIFNLFVFFEIFSIASYALVSYTGRKKAVLSSIKYLIMGSFSTSLILLGIVFVYGSLGTLNMADIASKMALSSTTATILGFGLLISGFMFKAAIAPFHAWKPSVIRDTPLSLGLMFTASGTIIGLYAIFRLVVTVGNLNLSGMLIALSFVTMVLGAVLALQTTNLKKLLAYSAISQTGYVLLAFGLLSYAGFVYHMINLVLIDIILFIVAYVVIKHFGTSDLDKMGGLGVGNPVLFGSALVAVSALAGLPLFNGFSSKLLIYQAGIQVFPIATLIAMLVSVLTLAYSSKMLNMIFFSNRKDSGVVNIDYDLKIIMVTIAVFCVVLGIFQGYFTGLMEIIAGSGLDRELYIKTVLGLI
ncbi:MAG: hypothetical protein GQ477_01530 [Nanohaloarchaea archaeon]|nr:hypothetical protein [Candidatus Nanohaloarchaea archaeon]